MIFTLLMASAFVASVLILSRLRASLRAPRPEVGTFAGLAAEIAALEPTRTAAPTRAAAPRGAAQVA